MAQVGMSIGSSRNLHDMVSHFKPRILLLPLATALGTLCFQPWRHCCWTAGA